MKKCNECKGEYFYDMFHLKKASPDGYNNVCKICKKEKNKLAYQKNRDSKLAYQKEYREKNKEVVDAYKKAYNISYFPSYYKKNKPRILLYNNSYHEKRMKVDENFKIRKLLRSRFHHALKNNFKIESIINLLGCSIDSFKDFLSSQFLPEMNWNNHGEIWEIDHIKPCFLFDLTNPEEQKKCFHYTNMQPLFKTSDIAKSFGYIDQIGNRNKPKK